MQSLKIFSAVFLLVVAVALFFIEQRLENHFIYEERQLERNRALHDAQDLRIKMTSQLIQAVEVLNGFRAYIETNPEITQEEFSKYALSVMRSNQTIRSIAAAPDLVVKYTYPLAGNEAVIGLDYRTAPMEQRAAAFRTMREKKSIIAGPVKLVQGGFAFIVRIPVHLIDTSNEIKNWGLLAAPLNVETFYQEVGLADFTAKYSIAIRGHDGLGNDGDVFFGSEELFSESADSVVLDVEMENGFWVMAVKPYGGWRAESSNQVFLRASFLTVFVIFSITLLAVSGYYSERIRARHRKNKSLKEKAEFLEILSHEIRSPLQGVLGAQKYLLDNGLTDPMRTVVEEAHQSGDYIHSLINDYLDLQRAESEGLPINLVPTEIRETIENSFKIATMGKKRRSLAVNFHIAENVPSSLMLDQAKVRQILINITGNALKYTARGFVRIGANYVENEERPLLILKVEDTGIGIDKKELANLFDRFTRSEVGEKRGGSGLGLAIAKSLIEAMDGRIEVESGVGKGTTFIVKLPTTIATLSDQQHEKRTALLSDEEIRSVERKTLLKDARVLVADDVVVNRILINAMLSPFVKKIVMVEDGQQTLEELEKSCFDMVIMDVHMPIMNGKDATINIRANSKFKEIPIIGLTGDEATEVHKELFTVGMDAVLVKPINLEPLLQRIETVFGRGPETREKAAS